jgi:hypothetical protein
MKSTFCFNKKTAPLIEGAVAVQAVANLNIYGKLMSSWVVKVLFPASAFLVYTS